MNNPLVTIILPAYNGADRIEEAIRSVISQSFTNWELLVIDDGSVDNTKEVIDSFTKNDSRIKYIKNENNLGIQKTLNKGLKEAKGEYVARIDDDDEWIDKDKLKKQFDFLQNNKNYVLVGTGVVVTDKKSLELLRYLFPENDQSIRNKLLSKNCFAHSSVLFSKNVALSLGGYPEFEYLKHNEDYYLWLKIGLIGKFYNLPIYAIKYTQRKGSISSSNKLDQFKKNLILIKEFKKQYPKYYRSLIFGYLRLFLYKIFNLIPSVSLKSKIFKLYKEF